MIKRNEKTEKNKNPSQKHCTMGIVTRKEPTKYETCNPGSRVYPSLPRMCCVHFEDVSKKEICTGANGTLEDLKEISAKNEINDFP